MEAVGIEEVAVHPVSRIDGGISRTTGVGQPPKSAGECGPTDDLGTNDPRILARDELLARIHAAAEARQIEPSVAATMIALIYEIPTLASERRSGM